VPTISGTATATLINNSASPSLAFNMPETGERREVGASIGLFDAGGANVNSVTYGGEAMTQVVTQGAIGTTGLKRDYVLVDPPSGNNNLVVNASAAIDEAVLAISGWTDVDQTTPAANPSTQNGNGNTSTAHTATLSEGDVLIGSIYTFSGDAHSITPSDNQTAEREATDGDESGFAQQYSTDGTMNWTMTDTPDWQSTAFRLIHDGGEVVAGQSPRSMHHRRMLGMS